MSQDFIGIVDNEYESELTSSIRYDIQKFFKGFGEAFKFLLTPSWGSKRRAEQQAYEERLDEAMKRAQAGRDKKADV